MNERARLLSEPVMFDDYYFVDVVTKMGSKTTIPARGFNLKSWVNFEHSLGSECSIRKVSEEVWMKTHWTNIPYEDEPVPVKKPATKKSTKTVTKKAISKKPVKTAVKSTAKKTAKKTVKGVN